LARSDDGIVLAGIVDERSLTHPGHELVRVPGHGRNHDGDLVFCVDLALDVTGHTANASDIRDGRSAELHHYDCHASTRCANAPYSAPRTRYRGRGVGNLLLVSADWPSRAVLIAITRERCNKTDVGLTSGTRKARSGCHDPNRTEPTHSRYWRNRSIRQACRQMVGSRGRIPPAA